MVGERPLPGCRLLAVSAMAEGTRELPGSSFIRALILFIRAPFW